MSETLIETQNDLDASLEEIFEQASNIKTEKSIVTYDVNSDNLMSDNSEYILKLSRESIDDEKELHKFIKKCESMIRMSPEYTDWTSYIREVMNMTKCMITGELHENAKSDIHHHPITLYVIVKAVILKYMASAKEFNSIEVIDEVMKLHYEMKTPFVVLLKSIHELYHSGNLLIPMELVQGDINFFVKEYGGFLDEDDLGPILDKLKINWNNCGYSREKYNWSNRS